ncbi:hypothetical protein [Streptomyces sp. N35]|uniref:hypothetical protein n=1 Tax=Streptomyces sp. N35 TaxID=2795730 RepID=UPI0018F773A4|nr:hypothetical protein [Streptomyces sp. N35]
MRGERSRSGPPSVRFEASWCATDLGAYRDCAATYERYRYESLPPLEAAQFTGAFQWLGGTGEPIPEQVTALSRLAEDLTAKGVTLPRDFVTYHADSKLALTLDEVSVTGCWTDISEPLPSPVEPGAFLVRFLRDQQDCVLWYLYLRPTGETFVVDSYLDYEYMYEAQRDGDWTDTDLDDLEEQTAAITWSAPSFEEFAARFWIENRLWLALQNNELPSAEPQLRDYLRHYGPLPADSASVEEGARHGRWPLGQLARAMGRHGRRHTHDHERGSAEGQRRIHVRRNPPAAVPALLRPRRRRTTPPCDPRLYRCRRSRPGPGAIVGNLHHQGSTMAVGALAVLSRRTRRR